MFELSEYIGIIAFAMSGFFVAVKNRLDLLGVLISTFLTALGGGIIRDVLIDRAPFTFTHTYPALTVLLVMVFMILFQFHKRNTLENKPLFILSDSIGLVSFSISGALTALETNYNLAGVIVITFVSAVGGGIVRDVTINEVPFVLKTGFYGTVTILIAVGIYLLDLYKLLDILTIATMFILALSLRLFAYYKKWSIPLR